MHSGKQCPLLEIKVLKLLFMEENNSFKKKKQKES